MKRLFRADPYWNIVIAQYQRDDFDLGSEHEFDWGIAIVSDPIQDAATSLSHTYRAIAELHPETNRKVWRVEVDRAAILGTFCKWRGGVAIGAVMESKLEELNAMLSGHTPVPKFDGWNCRDWVMEAIRLLNGKGWIYAAIDTQGFLSKLRDINEASKESMSNGGAAVVNWDVGALMCIAGFL